MQRYRFRNEYGNSFKYAGLCRHKDDYDYEQPFYYKKITNMHLIFIKNNKILLTIIVHQHKHQQHKVNN